MKKPNILFVLVACMIMVSVLFTAYTCASVKTDMVELSQTVEDLSERVSSLEVRVSVLEAKVNR